MKIKIYAFNMPRSGHSDEFPLRDNEYLHAVVPVDSHRGLLVTVEHPREGEYTMISGGPA